MNFEVFDAIEIEQYKAEVKSKWGNSKAYQEHQYNISIAEDPAREKTVRCISGQKGYFGTLLGRAGVPFCLHEKAPAAGHFQTGQRVLSFISWRTMQMIYFAATFLVTITSLSSPQTLCRTMVPALTGAVSTTLRISSITGKIISLGIARVRRTLVTGSSPPLTSTELAMVRRGAYRGRQ